MNILILQGPNLNLLGLKSSENGKHLTLDKLNKAIRKHVHGKDVTLKFLQTHKQYQAINILQSLVFLHEFLTSMRPIHFSQIVQDL